MLKQFMKMANKKTEKDFLKAYPTEESFFRAFPQAKKMVDSMMYGGSYAKGGGINNPGFKALPGHVQHKIISNMAYGGYYADGGQMEQEMAAQQQAQQQGGAGQQEQIIQFIVQALQQGMAPEEIIAQLAQAGIPEQQGSQLVQAVVQRMEQMQQAAPQEGQMPAEEEMPQEAAPEQMMRKGGTPCYECGGKYKKGGEYSGTYYQGTYFADGGSANDCPDGMVYSDAVDDCVPVEEATGDSNNPQIEQERMNAQGRAIIGNPRSGRFDTGFGLSGKNYNFNYGFSGNDDFSEMTHSGSVGLPNMFSRGSNKGGLNLSGSITPKRGWNAGLSAEVPLNYSTSNPSLLRFTGGTGQQFMDEELTNMMSQSNSAARRNYNVGVGYEGNLFGKRGPKVNIRANYSKSKHGGPTKKSYKKGGEYDMSEKEIQDLINKGYKIQYL